MIIKVHKKDSLEKYNAFYNNTCTHIHIYEYVYVFVGIQRLNAYMYVCVNVLSQLFTCVRVLFVIIQRISFFRASLGPYHMPSCYQRPSNSYTTQVVNNK